jgi:hypothetical protein
VAHLEDREASSLIIGVSGIPRSTMRKQRERESPEL